MAFSINVPVKTSDYFTTVRLTVGGLCAKAGFDIDETEDVKVCVTESLLILQRNGYHQAEIEFAEEDLDFKVTVSGKEKQTEGQCGIEDEISYALLGALVDDVAFENNDGVVQKIVLRKS